MTNAPPSLPAGLSAQDPNGPDASAAAEAEARDVDAIVFEDNALTAALAGETDAHLVFLEAELNVRLQPRGNRIAVSGTAEARRRAIEILRALYQRLEQGDAVGVAELRAAIRLQEAAPRPDRRQTSVDAVKTQKRVIHPRSPNQRAYLDALRAHDLTFGVGPAGTGKTYLAVAHALELFLAGAVERIILSRPAVEAGEHIGFLPGDMKEKVDPYMRPLYDALYDMMHADYIEKRLQSGEIEIAPLAFMRGRTLTRSAVILDEAQNATPTQIRMFLTRLGDGSQMAITGDPSQSDLGATVLSGLCDALRVMRCVEGVGVLTFEAGDVVRHPLVSRIIRAYEREGGRA